MICYYSWSWRVFEFFFFRRTPKVESTLSTYATSEMNAIIDLIMNVNFLWTFWWFLGACESKRTEEEEEDEEEEKEGLWN